MDTMTLLGLYDIRPDLFDLLNLPAGIDKQTCIDNILLKSADFEVMYPDPDFMYNAIGMFSMKWSRTFTKWKNALDLTYDPISNYDRHEEWTDNNTGESTVTGKTTDVSSASVENKVSAYNSSTMQPDTSSSSSGSGSSTLDNKNTSKNNNIRKGRAWGNIGVMTSQQMVGAELDLAAWNLYEHIADVFLQEFVIPVY